MKKNIMIYIIIILSINMLLCSNDKNSEIQKQTTINVQIAITHYNINEDISFNYKLNFIFDRNNILHKFTKDYCEISGTGNYSTFPFSIIVRTNTEKQNRLENYFYNHLFETTIHYNIDSYDILYYSDYIDITDEFNITYDDERIIWHNRYSISKDIIINYEILKYDFQANKFYFNFINKHDEIIMKKINTKKFEYYIFGKKRLEIESNYVGEIGNLIISF